MIVMLYMPSDGDIGFQPHQSRGSVLLFVSPLFRSLVGFAGNKTSYTVLAA